MEATDDLSRGAAGALRGLVELSLESARGFARAARHVRNPIVAHVFRVYGDSREDMARELRTLLEARGVECAARGLAAGALHRLWLEVRGTIGRGRERPILAEALRGEDVLMRGYERAMRDTAGDQQVQEVLCRHCGNVRRIHNRIRSLLHHVPERA